VYDLTSFDSNNPPEPGIWERGMTEADQVLYWFEKGITELTIMRNGAPNSHKRLITYILPTDDGKDNNTPSPASIAFYITNYGLYA
jgi:hypothetical protein